MLKAYNRTIYDKKAYGNSIILFKILSIFLCSYSVFLPMNVLAIGVECNSILKINSFIFIDYFKNMYFFTVVIFLNRLEIAYIFIQNAFMKYLFDLLDRLNIIFELLLTLKVNLQD
jgi:hypothetical protein